MVRRIRGTEGDPEQRFEAVLAEQRRELESQAARFEEAVRDLERREQLLRDARASLERLLRLSTTDIESRESELVQLMRELSVREERLGEAEVELARRREELGAVELKRAAVERRERAVEEREGALAGRETETASAVQAGVAAPLVLFVPGPGYRIRELRDVSVEQGALLEVDGEQFVVTRIGPSPLPRDRRRCAYLAREARDVS
jgi:hypothetical protein